jgi:hydrogenase maturation factor
VTLLPDGKLPVQLLRELLSKLAVDLEGDLRVKAGPAIGEDAAAIDRGDHYLLLAADPITFSPKRIGWYSVQVNANDIAAMGGKPQYFLSTILLPSGAATEDMARTILSDIAAACREIGALAVGGHTEVTPGIDRPLVAGAMVGEVEKDRLLTSAGARPGDMVLITKGIAIEATAILAEERAREVREAFGEEFQRKAAAFLTDPGISVLSASAAASEAGGVTAMHDVTEGGIANALWEVAEASGVGMVVIETEIPRFWESTRIAERFQMDLLGAIGSGALVLTTSEPDTGRLLTALEERGSSAFVIGRVVSREKGVSMVRGKEEIPLPRFTRDEVARVLSEPVAGP